MHRYFGFAIATLQIFQHPATLQIFQHPENVKISIFPSPLSQQKCYIFKIIERILKNVFFAERWGRWLLWLKISIAQTFWFCNNNVTTIPTSRKCITFNFSLYTVTAEMLYLQKWLTNFQKLLFGWKWGRRLLWLKISSAPIFWVCNSNVTTFRTSRKGIIFNFSLYTVPAEMLYLQKYFMNFQKLSFGWKMRRVATVVENINCTDVLVLQ